MLISVTVLEKVDFTTVSGVLFIYDAKYGG
jgi:hypothetical protein